MPLITADILTLYQCYNGDSDWLARTGSVNELKLFDEKANPSWYMISSAIQDMDLISKGLASKEFAQQALTKLEADCDEHAFKELIGHIPVFSDFQTVATIVGAIKSKINTHTDFVYTRFSNFNAAAEEVRNDIENLKLCDFETLSKINIDFAPTGAYQELAIADGWTDEYLKLSAKFDAIYNDLNNKTRANLSKGIKDRSEESSVLNKIITWLSKCTK